MVLEFTMRIFPAPLYSTYNLYYTFTDLTPTPAQAYPLDSIKPVFLAWIQAMAAQKEDEAVGGNNLVLTRDIADLSSRTYRLYLSGFCRGDACDWPSTYSSLLAAHAPTKVNVLGGERSSFADFGIIKEVLPLIVGYPLQDYYLNELSALTYDFTSEMVEAIIDFMVPQEGDTKASENFYGFETTYFSGSVKQPKLTSFAYGDIEWKSNFFIMWDDQDSEQLIQESARSFNAMMEKAAAQHYAGNYFNYIDATVDDWRRKYFGKNYKQLTHLKAKYDPDQVFKRKYAAIPPVHEQ